MDTFAKWASENCELTRFMVFKCFKEAKASMLAPVTEVLSNFKTVKFGSCTSWVIIASVTCVPPRSSLEILFLMESKASKSLSLKEVLLIVDTLRKLDDLLILST